MRGIDVHCPGFGQAEHETKQAAVADERLTRFFKSLSLQPEKAVLAGVALMLDKSTRIG